MELINPNAFFFITRIRWIYGNSDREGFEQWVKKKKKSKDLQTPATSQLQHKGLMKLERSWSEKTAKSGNYRVERDKTGCSARSWELDVNGRSSHDKRSSSLSLSCSFLLTHTQQESERVQGSFLVASSSSASSSLFFFEYFFSFLNTSSLSLWSPINFND